MVIVPLNMVIFPLKIVIVPLKIVIFPLKIVIFHSYVSLPDDTWKIIPVLCLWKNRMRPFESFLLDSWG